MQPSDLPNMAEEEKKEEVVAKQPSEDEIRQHWRMIECFWEPLLCDTGNNEGGTFATLAACETAGGQMHDGNCFQGENQHTLTQIYQNDSHALTLRFNQMNVDLFRRSQFDAWFTNQMVESPEMFHSWKQHFDKWADNRIAKAIDIHQQKIVS